jgi:hypothetical protein
VKNEPQFTLTELTAEEKQVFEKKLNGMLDENNYTLFGAPYISNEGKVAANVIVLKKVKLVPEGVPSPFIIPNGGTNPEETNEGAVK